MRKWYDQYESQCWYTNSFLVNKFAQIAKAQTELREWNNINDSGCNFVCLSMMLGLNPAYLASLLAAQGFFREDRITLARSIEPKGKKHTGKPTFLVWDDNRPYPPGESMSIVRFWHPRRGRTSCRLTLLEIKRAADVKEANGVIAQARRAGLHVICGYDDHSHLVAGSTDGQYFLWDPVGDESHWHFKLTVEANVGGRYLLKRFFDVRGRQKEFKNEEAQFWIYRLHWTK
jgi:hypothetical protein